MALNLNKENDNPNPNFEGNAAGLNLNRSDEPKKSKFNLSKDTSSEVVTNTIVDDKTEEINTGNKKSRISYILIVLFLFGIGLFWFLNQVNDKPNESNESNNVTNQSQNSTITDQPQTILDNSSQNDGKIENQNNSNIPTQNNNSTDSKKEDLKLDNNSTLVESNSTSLNIRSDNSTKSKSNLELNGSLEDKARSVIQGKFGNGAERKRILGIDYFEIQSKVNEMYNNGFQ